MGITEFQGLRMASEDSLYHPSAKTPSYVYLLAEYTRTHFTMCTGLGQEGYDNLGFVPGIVQQLKENNQ